MAAGHRALNADDQDHAVPTGEADDERRPSYEKEINILQMLRSLYRIASVKMMKNQKFR
jgi:hypothetical protein